MSFIGGVSMISTLFVLTKSARAAGSHRWSHYSGALLFLVVFFVVFLSFLAYRATAYFKETEWRNAAAEFVTCLLMRRPFDPSIVCGDGAGRPAMKPSASFWHYVHFIVSGNGIFAFLIYGTSRVCHITIHHYIHHHAMQTMILFLFSSHYLLSFFFPSTLFNSFVL